MKKILIVAALVCSAALLTGTRAPVMAQSRTGSQLPCMEELQSRYKKLQEDKKYLVIQLQGVNGEIAKLQANKQVDHRKLQDLQKKRDLYTKSFQNIQRKEAELSNLMGAVSREQVQKKDSTVRNLR